MMFARNNKPIAFLFFIGYKNTTFERMGEKIYDIKVAKEKIQHYCAIMDRCQFQVMTKLKSYGLSAGLSEDILVELIQNISNKKISQFFRTERLKYERTI